MRDLENLIYKYYPRNISYFSGDYENTQEYNLLKGVLNQEATNWESFINYCGIVFNNISIEDKTIDAEPGHILLFYIYRQGIRYILVLYLSKIIKNFCYRVEVIKGDPNTYAYPNFKKKLKGGLNKSPEEINDILNKILSLISLYFPQHSLFTINPDEIVPDISTLFHDLGEATIFNILFSNHVY